MSKWFQMRSKVLTTIPVSPCWQFAHTVREELVTIRAVVSSFAKIKSWYFARSAVAEFGNRTKLFDCLGLCLHGVTLTYHLSTGSHCVLSTHNFHLCLIVLTTAYSHNCRGKMQLITRKPTNWWGQCKRDVTHPTATVVYNTSYHLFWKRSFVKWHRLACASWRRQQHDTSQLCNA